MYSPNVNTEYKDQYIEHREKNKNGKKKIIIIIISVLVILGIVAAIVIPNLIKKGNKKEEVLTKESKVVKELFDTFKENDNNLYSFAEEHQDNIELYKMAVTYLSIPNSKFKETKCSQVDVDIEEDRTCNKYNGDVLEQDSTVRYISEEVFEKQYKKLFGKENNYTNHSIIEGCFALHYDNQNKNYVEFTKGDCSESITLKKQEITKVKQDGKKLIIETVGENENGSIKTKITYTFEKEKSTGNYIFISRESTEQ